ncbi:MAG: hypothetical protein IPJ03_16850 [Ignavibacteriales bacterium]|nr:hypothetical protein [Ignavibacteriales bacterium]
MTKEERTEALLESAKNADDLKKIIADYITQIKANYYDLVFMPEMTEQKPINAAYTNGDEE